MEGRSGGKRTTIIVNIRRDLKYTWEFVEIFCKGDCNRNDMSKALYFLKETWKRPSGEFSNCLAKISCT